MARAADGKVALVVGAEQGIGRAAAERLHQDGCRVAVGYFNNDSANEVAAALGGKEDGVVAGYVNATDRDSVFAAVEETATELGGFDVIINNAGIAPRVSLEDATEKDFDTIFALNVKGVLWGIQAATAKLKELGHGGKIISAASQAGHEGNAGIPLYSATKFAVRGLSQTAARDLAQYGITVNTYAPGIVRTPLMNKLAKDLADSAGEPEDWAWNKCTEGIALGRLSDPEDIAKVISFLSGPDSDYITGQSILVDGGMVFN